MYTEQTVALGTGSKCLGIDTVSKNGTTLADSHAEVVCRRAFVRYLHAQLMLLAAHSEHMRTTDNTCRALPDYHCIFRSCDDADGSQTQRIVLHEEIDFHMYVSQPPCGDASIFEMNAPQEYSVHVSKRRRIVTRTGVDGKSEDSKSLTVQSIQTCGGSSATSPQNDPECASTQTIAVARSSTNNAVNISDMHRTGAKVVHSRGEEGDRDYLSSGVFRTKPGRGSPTRSMSCSGRLFLCNDTFK